ncbi:uncharacterized protein LOC141680663 [Apium graveolens]|uniref:uncharacterized protein LOC141680663 n=1 Tax=Apium graveolens TaxID=4045 RepID=UPI003D7B5943
MPFGLTIAPASFQSWMNVVFRPLLRKCVLVFFDDVLVYSKNFEDHWIHLAAVFQLMKDNNMFMKASKCAFAVQKIEYLGHFISAQGVETDPNKVSAVNSWQVPRSVKELRGFLGLAGFVKKEAFEWTKHAQKAFEELKVALTTTPVLAVPNFDLSFIVEIDASNKGIRVVLMQQGHPLAFISRTLGPKWQKLSVYEKELLNIVFAVQKWEQYLSAYHPATNGQTKVVNRCLENYLRCMCSFNEKTWCSWLPLSEWWYNTHFHTSSQITPYEVVYGQPPLLHFPYLAGEVINAEVDRSLRRREQIMADLKSNLQKAQQRIKVYGDKHRSDRSFAVDDWVWLKLQLYRQHSIHQRGNYKLSARFYGPFQVIVVGKVAYKLRLPSSATIHDVFHVSQLKVFHGQVPLTVTLRTSMRTSDRVPLAILERRVQKVNNTVKIQFLVHWEGLPDSEAT